MLDGYTSEKRSQNASQQLRDSKGRFVQVGASRVTWYSSDLEKELVGTVDDVTPDGENVVVTVTDEQGNQKQHIVAASTITIVGNKALLPTNRGSEEEIVEAQKTNFGGLTLPENATDEVQDAFDFAVSIISSQGHIVPGRDIFIEDKNKVQTGFGDLITTSTGAGFIIGVLENHESVLVAHHQGVVTLIHNSEFSVVEREKND